MAHPSDLKRRLRSLARWIEVLRDGLDGRPHSLGMTAGQAMQKALATIGVELLTRTAAAKQGLTLRPRQSHVARRYYGAPLKRTADLYTREQFTARSINNAHVGRA